LKGCSGSGAVVVACQTAETIAADDASFFLPDLSGGLDEGIAQPLMEAFRAMLFNVGLEGKTALTSLNASTTR
jgi:hypothetical protein